MGAVDLAALGSDSSQIDVDDMPEYAMLVWAGRYERGVTAGRCTRSGTKLVRWTAWGRRWGTTRASTRSGPPIRKRRRGRRSCDNGLVLFHSDGRGVAAAGSTAVPSHTVGPRSRPFLPACIVGRSRDVQHGNLDHPGRGVCVLSIPLSCAARDGRSMLGWGGGGIQYACG